MEKIILYSSFFLFLLPFIGGALRHGGNHMVPTFMWIDGHLSSQGIPYLNVRFPDRKWDDFVVFETLEPSGSADSGHCNLTGHLFHEKNVAVEMTKGCPLSKSFEIFFNTSRLSLSSFRIIEGKSKAILQKLSRDEYKAIAAASNVGSDDKIIQFPDEGFVLTLKAFYDQSFKQRFDIASEFMIQKIVEKTQNIFTLPSLTTTVKIQLQETEEIPTTIFSSWDNLNETALNYTSDMLVNAFVFFSDEHFDDSRNDESQGMAFIGKICSSDPKNRVAIVEWTNSLLYTSSILAHEIGHLLGMEHDFIYDKPSKSKYIRRDKLYKKCTSINGLMDYEEERKLWSTCSVEDFINYYNKVTQEGQKKHFCLQGDQLPSNGIWGEWSSLSACSSTCGDGIQTQKRNCNKPTPSADGNSCIGSNTLETRCNMRACPLVYSKVLVAIGYINNVRTDFEIIDLLSSETTCQRPKIIHLETSYSLSGGLGFQEKPLICGGAYYNPAACHLYEDGAWKSSYSLKKGRYYFAMTKSPFQDGSKLFLTGGFDGSSHLSSSEVLTENGWHVSVPLPVTVDFHCMVTINSTSVMVIGGRQNGKISGRSFLFNSETNIWTEGPKLNIPRLRHSCGSIRKNSQTEDKSLIAVGGYHGSSLSSVEVLDLDSDAWRRGSDLPFAIAGARMVEDPSGGVVLIGGNVSGVKYIDSLYRLSHAGSDATWELMSQKVTPRIIDTAFLIPDDIAACN